MAQEVFAEALRAAGRRDVGRGWLHRAAVTRSLNVLRGRRRREARERRWLAEPRSDDPAEAVLERESALLVRHALARLPRRSAEVLILRHSGLAYREVADALGVGVGEVGTMLRRAEQALRREVERESH